MKLNCSYCGKLVRTMRLSWQGSPSGKYRGKLVRTLGTGFNLSSVTASRRRLRKYGVHTRVTCKTCKPKVRTQSPLDYLTKALASTLEDDDMDVDDNICLDDGFLSQYNFLQTESDDNLQTNETVKLNGMSYLNEMESGLLSWNGVGTSNMLEQIAEQQGILRELVDSMPLLPNERYMRHFVYNVHNQMEERQNFLNAVDVPEPIEVVDNIPAPIAEQQELARLDIDNVPDILDRNNENNPDNMYEALSARIAFLDKQLKEIEDEYAKLRKRITDSLMSSKKVDETVAAAMKFLGRQLPEDA